MPKTSSKVQRARYAGLKEGIEKHWMSSGPMIIGSKVWQPKELAAIVQSLIDAIDACDAADAAFRGRVSDRQALEKRWRRFVRALERFVLARHAGSAKVLGAALAREPALRGRVVVHYVVEEDGWGRTARPGEDTDLPDSVAQCVAAQFVGLAYPQAGSRVEVHYPPTFEP